jgi:hypothetical protein
MLDSNVEQGLNSFFLLLKIDLQNEQFYVIRQKWYKLVGKKLIYFIGSNE